MNKKFIRLTENDLHRIVKESVNRVLNEIDYSSIPTGDFTERNKWWKTQMDNDFPNHNVVDSNDYQKEYYNLHANKINQDKLNAKKEKENAKLVAKAEKDAAKNKRLNLRNENLSLFKEAVKYTLYGDEGLLNQNQYVNLGDENWGDEEWDDWYDGISRLPLIIRHMDNKIVAEIFGVGVENASYDPTGYDYICEWGVTWGEGDDEAAGIVVGVKLDQKAKRVYTDILFCNNPLVNRYKSNLLINKYITNKAMKNMKIIAGRIDKWKNYNFSSNNNSF